MNGLSKYVTDKYQVWLSREPVTIKAELPEAVNFQTGESTTSTAAEAGTLEGKTVKAEFTAYGPPWGGIEGGSKFASGESADKALANGELCCAAPPTKQGGPAFGTKIQVQGTGTEYDGKIFTVKDRGGAIKIKSDGTWRFDLLLPTRKKQNAFGRRKGTAVIGG